MTELWTFRIYETEPPPDVSGWDVEATDGHIGKVDEATYEAGMGCIVVDTGFWIFGKKRMIPAGSISSIDLDAQRVKVNLTKDQIKSAPDFEAERRDEDDYRRGISDYYSGF
jgi:hypothetical protein